MSISDRDLVSIIKAHRDDSLGSEDGDLSNQRAEAMDRYHGRPYGNEVVGRSQVVSRDLSEAVDWLIPPVIRLFVQSGNIAEFSPVGPEDEALAQQESDYVNQVLMKDNNGFLILHDLLKEAALLKNCYVKHYWEKSEKVEEEKYSGLTIEQVQKLFGDIEAKGGEVTVKSQDSRFVTIPGMPPQNEAQGIMNPGQVEVFDLHLEIKRYCGKLVSYAVPSEEVRVSKRCRGSFQDSPFTEHVTRKTRSELLEMGMDEEFVASLPAHDERENNSEETSRDSVTDESDYLNGKSSLDRSMDEIEYCEAYIRVDYDGDGRAELRKVVTCADRIPPGDEWNEVIPAVPMSGGVIKRVPHRHVGESLHDEIADLQEILTTLKRQFLDNIYFINNSELAVNERVNLKDVMTRQPGGVKRVRGDGPIGDAISPIVTPSIVGDLLPAIDFINKAKETRTGVRPGNDLDPETLQQVTKGAYLENLNRASQKIEMIARLFGETVVKEWVLQSHAILLHYQDTPRMVQLRGKWVPVNPQEWRERTDLSLKVGLGTGNEQEKQQKMQLLSQLQTQLLQAAVAAPPPVYAKLYALFEDAAESMGFEMPEKYGIAPNGPDYQQLQQAMQQQKQQPNPEMMKEQMKGQVQLQVEGQRNQLQIQGKKAELEVQAANDARDAEREDRRMQAEFQLEQMRLAAEQQKLEKEYEFRRWQAELDAAVKLQQSSMQTQVQNAATQNAEREVVEEVKGPDSSMVLASALEGLNQALAQMRQPRTIIRGPDGRAEGIA